MMKKLKCFKFNSSIIRFMYNTKLLSIELPNDFFKSWSSTLEVTLAFQQKQSERQRTIFLRES